MDFTPRGTRCKFKFCIKMFGVMDIREKITGLESMFLAIHNINLIFILQKKRMYAKTKV